MPTGVFSNNQELQLEYNSFQNVLLLSYNKFIFKLINYQAVLNTPGIAGITLKGSIKTDNNATNKSSSDESIITLNLASSDEAIIEEYIKDLTIYMFIKLTEEIITGKLENISKERAKLTLTYTFRGRFVKELTNQDIRFSFVKKSFFYTKKGSSADKPIGTGSITGSSGKYTISANFTFSNLPDRVYIRDVVPLYYRGNTLKAQVNLEIINQTKSLEEIEKCIVWKYVILDKDINKENIPVQSALSLTDMYDNDIDKVTGRILDICFMEELRMHLYGEYNSPQKAIAFLPSIEGLGKYQDFIYNKHAIILGYNGTSRGVTNSSSKVIYAGNNSYINLQAFHEPYLDNINTKYTHWICKINNYKEKAKVYVEKHKTNIIEDKNILKPYETLNLLNGDEEIYKLPVYGRNIRVYYREEWFGKKIFFYPLYSMQDQKIVEIWYIDQPISLKFDGEKLQIIEEGKVLKEYEARSGQMENREVVVNNTRVLTQHDNQTISDNQIQHNNTISLNMLNDNLKAVHYPGYSAVNTLNNVKNEKFYYDEKAKYKLEEGEYYIFGNKINKFKAGIFNFITRDTDKVGERYIQIHKNLKGDITEFSAEDEKMLIHGGINYEDKGGVDLSTGADEFFKDLEYIVKEKYHDKLYKVVGNIPIRLIVKYGKSLSIEEARVRAFLRMLRVGEGTKGPNGYETVVGGKLLKDYGKNFSQHPNILIKLSSTLQSTAAGAYQFLWSTWKDYAIKNGIYDFSPINQDKVCVILLKDKRHALDDIMKGNVRHAIELCNKEWASLPGSPYGQRTETIKTCLENYMKYLEEEINGKTSLAVPIGDLDDLLFK